MIKRGSMFVLDDDNFFGGLFDRSGDQFETGNLKAALKYVRIWGTAIDGGAHYGSWTRYLTDFAKIIAFEPRQDIHECLVRNTEHIPHVDCRHQALGDRMDSVSVGIGKHYDNSGCGTVLGNGDTPMITIDSLGLDDVGFIKLDVEGMEYHTLKGAEETLKRCKPVVLFEDKGHSEDYGVTKGECGKFLQSLGASELLVMSKRDFIYGWR